MRTIKFLSVDGTPHQISSDKKPEFTYSHNPFCDYKPNLGELIDYAMEMAVICKSLNDSDRPLVLQNLLMLRGMLDTDSHQIYELYKVTKPWYLKENFKNEIEMAKYIHAVDFIQNRICYVYGNYQFNIFDRQYKSELTSMIFGGVRYGVTIPNEVTVEIDGDILNQGDTFYVRQKRLHISNTLDYGANRKIVINPKSLQEFTLEGEDGLRLPCETPFPISSSTRDSLITLYHSIDVEIPLGWVTSIVEFDYIDGKRVEVERKVKEIKSNGKELKSIDTVKMKHNEIMLHVEKEKVKWIKSHKAHAMKDLIMNMSAGEFVKMRNAASELSKIKTKPRLSVWVEGNKWDTSPACIFRINPEYRTNGVISAIFACSKYLSIDHVQAVIQQDTLQSVLDEIIKINPSLFAYVPEQYESKEMGKAIERAGITDLRLIFKASSNIFSDNVIINASAKRENSFPKLKDVPVFLVTAGNLPSIMKKNGFDPSLVEFNIMDYMDSDEVRKLASKITTVKKWMINLDCESLNTP
ncbi:hypothetical protein P5704_024380 (plasmid) [Pseudomonas sp. FeN3W]|nr:hypothetical protein P5704_024380 [Pseudomonas sp. FeN3W]